jgi:xylulokinase
MPYSSTGGMVLKWFKDKFCNEESSIANLRKTSVFKILDEMAKDIPPGSEGLIMLPFITGAFFPEFNPQARGVFFGIGINHNKDHFIRSILESLGYMLKRDIEIMSSLGLKISDIISIGGGASSKLWSQIKADICKKPIKIPEYTESALLGCTILSAVAAGFFNNPENAIKSMVKIKNVYHPESKNGQIYDENFKKYLKLYRKLKGIF